MNRANILLSILLFAGALTFSIYAVWDVAQKPAEKQMFDFIKVSPGKYAFPNVMRYPDILYAYYTTEVKLSLDNYNFFRDHGKELLFYRGDSNFSELTKKVNYFIITEQMLQSLKYRESNKLHILPHYEALDVPSNMNIEKFLKENHFIKKREFETSEFETILKYDPASLNLKRILIYEKQ